MRVFSCFPVRWWSGGNATALPIKGIRKSQSREAQKTLEGGRGPCENAGDQDSLTPARGRQRGASRGNPPRAHVRTPHETNDQFQRRTRRPSPSRAGARPRRVPRLRRKRHVGDGAQPPREGVRGGPRRGDRPRPGTARRTRILRSPAAPGRSHRALRADPHELPRKGEDGPSTSSPAPGARRRWARRSSSRGCSAPRRPPGTSGSAKGRRRATPACPRPSEVKVEAGRRLPAHHLERDDPRRRVQRRPVTRLPGHGGRAADRGHVERLPLAPVRRDEVRHGLRRRPEEHRPVGRGGRGGVEGTPRPGAEGYSEDLPVPHPRREQVALQHAAHLRRLHGPQRPLLAQGTGGSRRDGGRSTGRRRRASTASSTATRNFSARRWSGRAAR